MNRRLTASHSSRPPTTDSVPARYLWRTPSNMSVGNLGHARQEQPFDREILRQVAERLERVDELVHPCFGHLAGRLEILSTDQEIVSLLHVVLLDLADLD